jgi:hypothetical protein
VPRKTFGGGGLEALQYKDGHTIAMPTGYVLEYCPGHPACNLRGHVPQHRLVMERHLGRLLSGVEIVHHSNGEKSDNRLENLLLFASQSAHMLHHQTVSKTHQENFLDTLQKLAADPQVTIRLAAGRLCCSMSSIHNALRRQGFVWRSRHNEGLSGAHPREYVLQVLLASKRKEAEKILGMTCMSLWRHYPEEMHMTARKKALKDGGQLGGTAKRGFHQDARPRIPSVAPPTSALLSEVPAKS